MKFGVVNKSTILNRFVLHTLQGYITHLDVITLKTNIKLGILKGGNWKRAKKWDKGQTLKCSDLINNIPFLSHFLRYPLCI